MRSLSKKLAAMGMQPVRAEHSRGRPRAGPPALRGARARARGRRSRCSRRTATPGLTTAKVAARSGQNKALIAYHFGSKQGLVAAAGARGLRVDHHRGARRPRAHRDGRGDRARRARRRCGGSWSATSACARLYFDLAAAVGGRARGARDDAGDARALAARRSSGCWPRRRRDAAADAEAAAVYVIAASRGWRWSGSTAARRPRSRDARERIVAALRRRANVRAALARRRGCRGRSSEILKETS